jgi:hypothetical protein
MPASTGKANDLTRAQAESMHATQAAMMAEGCIGKVWLFFCWTNLGAVAERSIPSHKTSRLLSCLESMRQDGLGNVGI